MDVYWIDVHEKKGLQHIGCQQQAKSTTQLYFSLMPPATANSCRHLQKSVREKLPAAAVGNYGEMGTRFQ